MGIKKRLTSPINVTLPSFHETKNPDTTMLKAYIESHWDTLRRTTTEDYGTLIGLPHDYLVPAARSGTGFHFEEMYYWDSFFIAVGLTDPKYHSLIEGMLDNLLYLYRRFSLVPNASRMYMTSRSQPPLLTSYIFHIYDTHKKDIFWLTERMEVAIDEYENVWTADAHPVWHQVFDGLSRYYDINMLHDLAEAESGWDMTPRFERTCLDYLPIDLNSLLYKYESDIARYFGIKKDKSKQTKWLKRASDRNDAMNRVMWHKLKGFYFDYNFQKKEKNDIWSLAGFYPLWSGQASEYQAKKLVSHLKKFEKRGGLVTTLRPVVDLTTMFGSLRVQWAYPNGWAPLHYFVCEGLDTYGYHAEANELRQKWVTTVTQWFDKHGELLEKYNMVNPKKAPVAGVYPSQKGFGWTNSITLLFIESLQ